MGDKENRITIFYSWQSDLPDETNRRAIRNCLREASAKVEADIGNLHLYLDEATRGKSGSPNIPTTILEKIEASDIFVADVSIINAASKSLRKCPNPNVVFELGFAAAQLGWGRIIMLFNNMYGVLSDLPFDFDRHRISPFSLSQGASKDDKQKLTYLLVTALKSVVSGNPKRPAELKIVSPEEKMRQRDVSNIRWVFSTIHLPTLDSHVDDAPYKFPERSFHFLIEFEAVMTSSLFHLYDQKLYRALRELHVAWTKATSYGSHYYVTRSGDAFIFINPGDISTDKTKEEAWYSISKATKKMERALARATTIVREQYLEIDLVETNDAAWREYVQFEKYIDGLIGDP